MRLTNQIATFAIAASLAISGSMAYGQEKTELIYATFASSELPDSKAIAQLIEAINAEAESIHYTASYGGAMGGPRELISHISNGVVHAGNIIDGYAYRELVGNSILRVLGNFGGNQIAVTAAINETILLNCPRCREDMTKLNLQGLASYAVPGYVLICRTEITNLEEFKKLRIRSVGEFAQIFKYIGATPAQIPFPETYEALQRGQVDCSHSQESFLRAANFWDVAKYVYNTPIGIYNTAQLFAVNGDNWAGMNQNDKDLILSKIPMAIADAVFRGMQEVSEVNATAGENGVVYAELPADIESKVMAYQQRENLMRAAAGYGVAIGYPDNAELVATYFAALDKWTARLPEISTSREAFAEALYREVYSKVEF